MQCSGSSSGSSSTRSTTAAHSSRCSSVSSSVRAAAGRATHTSTGTADAREDRRDRIARHAPRGDQSGLAANASPPQQAPPAVRVGIPHERTRLTAALPNIVLVHGAWADGSCWSTVIERLQADGHKVTAPQLPESSLAEQRRASDCVASRRRAVANSLAAPRREAALHRAGIPDGATPSPGFPTPPP
jgi:hypothetical protein